PGSSGLQPVRQEVARGLIQGLSQGIRGVSSDMTRGVSGRPARLPHARRTVFAGCATETRPHDLRQPRRMMTDRSLRIWLLAGLLATTALLAAPALVVA